MVMGDREKRSDFEVSRELSRLSDLKGVSLQTVLPQGSEAAPLPLKASNESNCSSVKPHPARVARCGVKDHLITVHHG